MPKQFTGTLSEWESAHAHIQNTSFRGDDIISIIKRVALPVKPRQENTKCITAQYKQLPPCHTGVILVKGVRAKRLCHLPNPCSLKKKLREKRGQPCGQKLIFLLVAHCCRRANMPRENSTTHTPLFSSGFSQLYTQQQSHNQE